MNEMDLLTRFRTEVPHRVSPRAEHLFATGLHQHPRAERTWVPRPGNALARIRPIWRLAIVACLVAGAAAGTVVAVQPSSPPLTAKLLADRASAAALSRPAVSPGQWVYLKEMISQNDPPKASPGKWTQIQWQTADDTLTYLAGGWLMTGHSTKPSYAQLGSLPRDPAGLDKYFAHLLDPSPDANQADRDTAAFSAIEEILEQYVLPPGLTAEVYQALGDIPSVRVDSHVTDIAGRPGVAFVLPATPHGQNLEIILNAADYSFMAQAVWGASPFIEQAILRSVLVSGPGSTQPDSAPPSPAELLAERAAAAGAGIAPPVLVKPGQWVYRELTAGTSARHQVTDVWATADDTRQATYDDGTLTACSRLGGCVPARSGQPAKWLVPFGPSYRVMYPTRLLPQALPAEPRALRADLNAYSTGCADTTGDCNAVSVIAAILGGYVGYPSPALYLALADIPGVTVQHVTDLAGQHDVALHFPFTQGVTGILLNARTYQFAGYQRGATETVITKQALVPGPGVWP
jgi:hypothetical protein